MSTPISDQPPIVVHVQADRWDAYSLHEPPTERDEELLALIYQMGGINEKVAPGIYKFDAVAMDESNVLVSLELIGNEYFAEISHSIMKGDQTKP